MNIEKNANENVKKEKNKLLDNAYWVSVGLPLGVVLGAIPSIGMGIGIPVGLGAAALVDIIIMAIRNRKEK